MPKLKIGGLGLLLLSSMAAHAESNETVKPFMPVAIPERGLELPFDFKTEPSMKFRGSGLGTAPAALAPSLHESLRNSFFGLGVTRPIDTLK